MKEKTKITLHGELGEQIRKEWNLHVNSVSEAINAIEILSKHKLYKYLIEKDKENIKYQVLINEKPFRTTTKINKNDPDTIKNSELCARFQDNTLKTIDIIPVIEGADSGGSGGGLILTILGVILVIVGIIGSEFGLGFLIPIGIGLIAGGVMMLLSRPPKFEDFREIQKGRQSYLFNGPYNTTEEGGPVPVGYGELIVGSQVISTSYDTVYSYNKLSSSVLGEIKVIVPGAPDLDYSFYIISSNYGYWDKPFSEELSSDIMFLTRLNE
jgi:predicted phage tail protein